MILPSLAGYPSGIGMYVTGDARYSTAIEQSPNGSTGWVPVTVLPPTNGAFVDFLPLDGTARYYRARSVEIVNGVITRAGPYRACAPASGKPRQLIEIGVRPPTLSQKVITQPLTDVSSRYQVTAYTATPVSVANNTATAVAFDSEIHDVGPLWTIGAPTRLVIPSASNIGGTWIIVAKALFAPNATGYRIVGLTKNGGGLGLIANGGDEQRTAVGTGGGGVGETVTKTWVTTDPAPGDYWEMWVTQTSGGALNVTGWFTLVHLW